MALVLFICWTDRESVPMIYGRPIEKYYPKCTYRTMASRLNFCMAPNGMQRNDTLSVSCDAQGRRIYIICVIVAVSTVVSAGVSSWGKSKFGLVVLSSIVSRAWRDIEWASKTSVASTSIHDLRLERLTTPATLYAAASLRDVTIEMSHYVSYFRVNNWFSLRARLDVCIVSACISNVELKYHLYAADVTQLYIAFTPIQILFNV